MQDQKTYALVIGVLLVIGLGTVYTANNPVSKFVTRNSLTTNPLNSNALGYPDNSVEIKPVEGPFVVEPISNDPSTNGTSQDKIKVALLLDTSGSMDGLIEQAKSQLWQILNELAKTEKETGQDTDLQIALYEYGNPSRASQRRQIRQLSAFTCLLYTSPSPRD